MPMIFVCATLSNAMRKKKKIRCSRRQKKVNKEKNILVLSP